MGEKDLFAKERTPLVSEDKELLAISGELERVRKLKSLNQKAIEKIKGENHFHGCLRKAEAPGLCS